MSRVITCPLARLKSNGRPNDQSGARYAELLGPLARTVGSLYPGWRMRIYHNVTSAQPAALASLCSLYCGHQHVDLCDTRRLPGLGDLNTQFPVGRFWRFQVRGHTCHVSRVTGPEAECRVCRCSATPRCAGSDPGTWTAGCCRGSGPPSRTGRRAASRYLGTYL